MPGEKGQHCSHQGDRPIPTHSSDHAHIGSRAFDRLDDQETSCPRRSAVIREKCQLQATGGLHRPQPR